MKTDLDEYKAKAKNKHGASLDIRLDNLTLAQAIAVEDMLNQWARLSSIGASRYVAFFADGDGNFRPKIEVNGRAITGHDRAQGTWENDVYKIDFDSIAWQLQDLPDGTEGVPSSVLEFKEKFNDEIERLLVLLEEGEQNV